MIKAESMVESTIVQSERKSLLLEFKGTGGEYFKIWIINLILTILTMGIYSAWAKVRTNRYFYNNTTLDKRGFEYHAKPITILKGRLVTVGVLISYFFLSQASTIASIVFAMVLFLCLPWIIWRSIKYNARMTSYRNVRFAFDGPLEKVYKYMLFLPLLPVLATTVIGIFVWLISVNIEMSIILVLLLFTILSTYIVIPSVQQLVIAYTINNYRYGQGRFRANLSMTIFYKIYLTVLVWSLVFFLIVGAAMSVTVSLSGFNVHMLYRYAEGELIYSNLSLFVVLTAVTYVGIILLGIFFKAYIRTKLRNYTFNQINLDNVLKLHSDISVGKLFGFYVVNFVVLVLTLGLAYPWVKVRIAQFMLDATQVMAHGRMDRYVTQQLIKQSALGEELSEAFDSDTAVEIG